MSTLRSKLPELILEAGMVVFAVVVALAVDEWREHRQNLDLAVRALDVVEAEVEANLEELGRNREANQALLTRLREVVRDSVLPDDFNVNFEYSLISNSAWESAQVTRATQFMSMERVQQLAKLYGLQALFQASQDKVMDVILNLGDMAEREPERIPRIMLGPVTNVVGMEQILTQAYDSTLARLKAQDPTEGSGPD